MEKPLTGFVMKETEGSKRKACLSLQASTYRTLESYLQVLKEPLNVSPIQTLFLFVCLFFFILQ